MKFSTEFTPEIKSFLDYAYPYAQEIAMNNGLSLDEEWHINDGRISDIHPQWQMLKEGDKIVEVDLFYFLENGYELGKIELELEDGETEIEFDFPEWEVKQERKFEYGGIMAKGGAVGEIDMDEIEKRAQFYTDEARWSKKPTIENFQADVEKYEELKEQLDNKETTPSKIIGRGYKPQYARPLAYKWLNEQILVAKRAIEILEQRKGKMKDGGEVGTKIRFDMYGYEDLNNKVQDGDTIIRVESYSMAEKKAKDFLYDNNYKLVELYRKDDLVGSIEHGGKFVYSKKYMSKHPEFNNVMADGGQVSGRYFIVKDGEYLTMMYGKYKFTDNKEFAYSWDASDESAQRLADSYGAKLKNVLDDSDEQKSDKSMKFIQYNGQEIMYEPHFDEYLVGEETFKSLEAAQSYIDGTGKKPSAKTISSYRHGMMAKGGSIKEVDIVAGKTFKLANGEEIKIVRLFKENGDEDWVEYERGGNSQENSVKQLKQFINRWKMERGGMVKWQDAVVGDNALVKETNKMGVIMQAYGRKFHLKFVDGSEKTYDAKELEFFTEDDLTGEREGERRAGMDDYEHGGEIPKGKHGYVIKNKKGQEYVIRDWAAQGYIIPYNGDKYWEHFQVPKKDWIKYEDINWGDFSDTSKNEFYQILSYSKNKDSEALKKYHQSFSNGGEIPKQDSMLHYMLNEASSGSIGNKTKYSSYKDIDGVRFAAIQILNRDGDRKYSLSAFNDLIQEAVLEYEENNTMAKGGKVGKRYSEIKKDKLDELNGKIKEVENELKKLENVNTKEAYEESNNLRQYKSVLEAKRLNMQDTMAKGGMTKEKAIELLRKYDKYEANNDHGACVLLLAENFGSEEDVEKIKSINKEHVKLGHLPNELYLERNQISDKLYPLLLLAAMEEQEKKWIEHVEIGDFLEASTGVEVVVVDYDESFGGRVRVLRTDEYSDGKPSPWKSVKDFKKKVDGKLYTIGKSKKKNSIELDTPIMPTIIADGVARDVLTEDNYSKFDDLVKHLVSKANTEYEENEIFRAKIKRRGNLGRDYLELAMKGWADKYLTGSRKKFDV